MSPMLLLFMFLPAILYALLMLLSRPRLNLLEPEKLHPWTGQTRMCKMLYVLRHTQHHLGEVTAELSRRGIKAAAWEKEKAAKYVTGTEEKA